jgi:hypothetical protein
LDLTRKRSQVQTLSRPPSFSLVNALSAPDRRRVLVPRPRCGRSLLPYRTEWALRSRTTPAQRPRRVISISRPSRPSHRQPVQDAPARRRVSSCSCSCPSQPTGTLRWTSSHVGPAASATPQPPRIHTGGRSAVDPVRSQAQPNPRPSLPRQAPIRAATTQPLADHRDISHPTRPDVGGPAAPTHARIQRGADSADAGATVIGGVSVRTPGSRRSRGHRSRGHRTSARPSGQTSARRTADPDRRPTACPASGHPRRPRPPAAGLAQPRSGCRVAALGHP